MVTFVKYFVLMIVLLKYFFNFFLLVYAICIGHFAYNTDLVVNHVSKNKEQIEKSISSKFLINNEQIEIEEEIEAFDGAFFRTANHRINQFSYFFTLPKSYFDFAPNHKVSLNILYCQLKFHL